MSLEPEGAQTDGLEKWTYAVASQVSIVPDTGMSGVVGDMILSKKTENPELHFVTPKKTIEIPDDYVILKAVGLNADEITANDPRQIVEWDGGEEVAGEPLKRKFKRDAISRQIGEIRIKNDGSSVVKINVWTVWVTGACVLGNVIPVEDADVTSMSVSAVTTWKVYPENIITDQDIPDLTGVNITLPPGYSKKHIVSNQPLSGGVNKKWDASRQIRIKVLNPNGYSKAQLPEVDGALFDDQPKAEDTPEQFPDSSSIEGNDDSNPDDEFNNPYDENGVGRLASSDNPTHLMMNTTGAVGDVFEMRDHFKEFVRLEIAKKWYRVSDPLEWRVHFKMKKEKNGDTESWKNNASDKALNNDGF
ncbi:hypothetical protein KBB96_07850 [Luteolibacter ambystomatis]|uniref:Uncharacterized protein n=1 Tax=Luteolibacter ambystomatis TaxID=2824561 RepID=A0A975PGP8_9BACT|nr:hypothetical protein [Luteolibacter ambystomatis]QUE52795.1 hypothetical protein KBB96_07850 [Luteolibacter ambystomatis]